MSENPYAAPATAPENLTLSSSEEDARQEHFSTESSIKSIGLLYYLASIAGIIATVGSVLVAFTGEPEAFVTLFVFVILAPLFVFVGHGLRKFKPWARAVATFFSCVGLLAIPLGTIINAYFLYLLWGKKGRMIFTPEYQKIITATPHLKYRTSKTAWVALLIFILALAGLIGFLTLK